MDNVKMLLWIIFICLSSQIFSKGELFINIDGSQKYSVSTADWEKKYKEDLLEIKIKDHPNYEKEIKYKGVNFYKFFSKLGREITSEDLIIITCTDGYQPVLKGEYFVDNKAVLAYEEVDPRDRVTKDGKWTKVKMEDEYVTPGPYYLVWPSVKNHKHSWPYQIQKISVIKKTNFKQFSKIEPKTNTTKEGFEIFKNKCIKCHSIKYIGPRGKAPDLASVVGYRTKSYIKNRIRKGRGKMPPFSKKLITDNEIGEVLKYLETIYETLK